MSLEQMVNTLPKMNEEKILADAIKQFHVSMEEAQKKLMDDFQKILKDAVKDAEKKLQERDSHELDSLEQEMENM
jgi:hypothetical protein